MIEKIYIYYIIVKLYTLNDYIKYVISIIIKYIYIFRKSYNIVFKCILIIFFNIY